MKTTFAPRKPTSVTCNAPAHPRNRNPEAPMLYPRLPGRATLLLGLLALLILLSGCSEQAPSAQTAPLQAPMPDQPAVASAKGRIDIEGGLIRLAARRDGIIARVLVEEGQHVEANQLLAALDTELAERQVAIVRSEAEEARIELSRAEVERKAAQRELDRLQKLAANESVARQEIDTAADRHSEASIATQAARAALATVLARIETARREIDERMILAPMAGQIVQRQARPGNGVSTLNVTPLFLFLPDAPRIVRAELEEHYLPYIALEQEVSVILEADHQKHWPGRVIRIGKFVGQRTPSEDPNEKQDTRVVEIVVAIDAPETLIGQRVVARFLPQRSRS